MKKITLVLSISLAGALMLTSCSTGGGEREAATNYINAMKKMDIATAKNFASDASKPMLDKMMEELKNLAPDQKAMLDQQMEKASKVIFTIKGVKENGDKAFVTYITSEDSSRVDSLPMIKQHGKWVVDITM